jgi:hypothetical protein
LPQELAQDECTYLAAVTYRNKASESMRSRFTLALAISAMLFCFWVTEAKIAWGQEKAGADTFFWMPDWRQEGDCGPSSLFVLMKLEGRNVTLGEVKDKIRLDPVKGCSLASLAEASEKFGFPVEVLYVTPSDVTKIPRPFIMHGVSQKKESIGHFIVVVDYDAHKRHLTVIDPIRERISVNPLDSFLMEYSGYVLIPKRVWPQWSQIVGAVVFLAGCLLLVNACRKIAFQQRVPVEKESGRSGDGAFQVP